jgi:hypothetical protein
MRSHRVRFTIQWLMLTVATRAVFLAVLRIEPVRGYFLIVVGPMIGVSIDRALGGRGVLGGTAGGVSAFWIFGAVMYVRAYLYPQPNTVDYLGSGLAFLILAFFGAIVGLVVGISIWGLVQLFEKSRDIPKTD